MNRWFVITIMLALTGSILGLNLSVWLDEPSDFSSAGENAGSFIDIVPQVTVDISKKQNEKIIIIKPKSFRRIAFTKSRKYEIEPSLIYALIKVESNWDARALSRAGAKGLMQLMPSTAKEMDVKNPFDPEENIEGGIRYLRYLLDRFNGDVTLALAAYNAGPNKVRKFKGVPPIKETQRYVNRILSIYNKELTL
jgi:soluble lytic murein transglycosylase-like protein